MNFSRGLALALVLLPLGACGEKKKASGLDWAAYGDVRHNPKIHRSVAGSLAASGAKFVLVTGDLVDYPDAAAEWTEFRDIVKDLRSRASYHCCVGDHDDGAQGFFFKEMGVDRWYYDVKEGDAHIFILDSRKDFSDKEQLLWLEKTAAASTSKHRFAVFHHPPFAIYPRGMEEAALVRQNIHPLLVKLKFCAAFCGHQHAFYSTLRDGVRYVVTAGGGATLKKIEPSLGAPGDLARKFHHFVGFRADGPKIQARVYDEDGVEAEDLAFTLCEHP